MDKIRVFVCDDMIYFCNFLEMLFNSSERCECIGTAQNEYDAINMTKELQPDVILLDIQMDEQESGIEILPKIIENCPRSKIIMISVHEDRELVFEAIRLGASDYVVKKQKPDEILKIVENVHEGNSVLRKEIAQKLNEQYKTIENKQKSMLYMFNEMLNLSRHEIDILKGINQGKSYEQLAEENFVEEVTIRSCVHRTVKKMHYKSISKLVQDLRDMQIFDMLK